MIQRTLLFLLLSSMLAGCGVSQTWNAIQENRKGVKALKAEDPTGASEAFIRGLAFDPFQAAFHHNLGLSFDLLKKPEESINSYKNAEKLAADPRVKFMARFNVAEALGRQKKIDEALTWYQAALEIVPDSVEVKTNIELLSQQGQGQGDGQSQDQNKDQNKDQQSKDQKDQKDDKGNDKDKDKDQEQKEKDKQYKGSQKYKPRPFEGELSENDVKKILGEIKQQEQRIRAEYNRKDAKEKPRDKDW